MILLSENIFLRLTNQMWYFKYIFHFIQTSLMYNLIFTRLSLGFVFVFSYEQENSFEGQSWRKRSFHTQHIAIYSIHTDLYGRAKTYINFQNFQITYLMLFFRPNHTSVVTSVVTSFNFADMTWMLCQVILLTRMPHIHFFFEKNSHFIK